MRFVRTILAVAIAASLALLPVGAAATGFAGAAGHGAVAMQAGSSTEASSSDMTADMAMDDCCPDAKANPCQTNGGKCPLGFCVAPGVGLAEIAALGFNLPLLTATAVPIPADQVVVVHRGNPPFRPPRV